MLLETIEVAKLGASAVTSQLKFPERPKLTLVRTTWLWLDRASWGQGKKLISLQYYERCTFDVNLIISDLISQRNFNYSPLLADEDG